METGKYGRQQLKRTSWLVCFYFSVLNFSVCWLRLSAGVCFVLLKAHAKWLQFPYLSDSDLRHHIPELKVIRPIWFGYARSGFLGFGGWSLVLSRPLTLPPWP